MKQTRGLSILMYLLLTLVSNSTFSQTAYELDNIVSDFQNGFTQGNFDMVRNAISDQLTMFNGNNSDNSLDWQAHQFLSKSEIDEWIKMMLTNAGPFINKVVIKNQSIRNNMGLVVTTETGQNKFRNWQEEEVVYLLGQINGSWKITGFFIKNLSNPD